MSKNGRLEIPLSEVVVAFAVCSFLIAVLVPAVNASREVQGLPSICDFLVPLYSPCPGLFFLVFPILSTAAFAGTLVGLRRALPVKIQACFPWRRSLSTQRAPIVPRPDSRPALFSAALALTATALLGFAASHVRVDRTYRRPVVTWEGFASPYVDHMAVLGWILSVVAIVVGVNALQRFTSRWNACAAVAVAIAMLNFFGSCLFGTIVYED